MCRSVARSRPRVPPQLSRRPIEQGGHRTRHFFSRLAAVGGNAPTGFDGWLVLDDMDGGYRVRVRVSFFLLLQQGLQQIQGGGMGLVFQMYHHGAVLG